VQGPTKVRVQRLAAVESLLPLISRKYEAATFDAKNLDADLELQSRYGSRGLSKSNPKWRGSCPMTAAAKILMT
jgi:hypothetical protein